MLKYHFLDVKILNDIDEHVDFISSVGVAMDDDLSIQDVYQGLQSFAVGWWSKGVSFLCLGKGVFFPCFFVLDRFIESITDHRFYTHS